MILEKPTPWGEIVGKLSLTPIQAWRMFNFKMKPNSKGVVIFKRNNKTIIRNLSPYKKIAKKTKFTMQKFATIGRIANSIKPLIYDAWNPLTPQLTFSGFALFTKINMLSTRSNKRGKEKWKNLALTYGPLPKPYIRAVRYFNNNANIYINNPNNLKIGFILLYFYKKTISTSHINPALYPNSSKISNLSHNYPILFIYFKDHNNYSTSSSIIIRKKAKEVRLWQNI